MPESRSRYFTKDQAKLATLMEFARKADQKRQDEDDRRLQRHLEEVDSVRRAKPTTTNPSSSSTQK